MKIKEHVEYWLDSANHDWDTAESLFSSSDHFCLRVFGILNVAAV